MTPVDDLSNGSFAASPCRCQRVHGALDNAHSDMGNAARGTDRACDLPVAPVEEVAVEKSCIAARSFVRSARPPRVCSSHARMPRPPEREP